MEHKTDISDLIPKGLGAYWLVFFFGVLAIGFLEFFFHQMPEMVEKFGLKTLAPFDLASPGNLLDWGLSLLLFLGACLALFNFHAGRQYKDPASRINVWFWWAVALVFLSMDVQVHFRETLREVMSVASGTTVYHDGTIWWLSIYGFLFAVIGTRLFLELVHYAPALGLYLLAASGAVAGALVRLELLPLSLGGREIVMLETALQGMIALLLFLSFALFARRQVFRDREVALQWFTRIWNPHHEAEKKTVPEKKPAPKEVVPEPTSQAAVPETPLKTPVPAEKPAPVSNPKPSAPVSAGRPVVQKDTGIVLFRNEEKKAKDDDFELSGTG